MLVYSNSRQTEKQLVNKTAGQRTWSDRCLGDKNITCNVKNMGVVHNVLFFTPNNPIRMLVAGTAVQIFVHKLLLYHAALPLLTCRGLIELQGMESDIGLSLLTISTHFRLYVTEPFVLVQLCTRASTHTLCAGTRLTNTVSNSSCDTVSPSQMMELIRSTMCMCTFWLWPLLGRWGEKGQKVKDGIIA